MASIPVALLIALIVAAGLQQLDERQAAAESYAAGERALAAGDLLSAQTRFAAAGGYRDAAERVAEVEVLLAEYRVAYADATAAFNAGRYDDAIELMLPVIAELPDDAESLALIDAARTERRRDLERQAAMAEDSGDWYAAERALVLLARDDPDDERYAERLAEIRMNRAPFVYARNGSIYIGSQDTFSDHPILAGYDASWPVWSPDRSRIAFVTPPQDQRRLDGRLYVVDSDGSNVRLLASDVLPFSWPVWSPDGTRIAITSAEAFDLETGRGHIALLVVDTATGEARDVSGERFDFATSPSWAPDGRRIAFVERLVANFSNGPRFENGDVWIVDTETGALTNLTGDAIDEERQVAWSPAGDRVAVITDPGDWNNQQPSEIYLVEVDSGDVSRVPTGLNPGPPAWSPDGARIAFVEGDNVIRVWSETASHWIPISTGIDDYVSWSVDGSTLLAPGSTFGQVSYVVSLEAGGGPPVSLRLTFDVGNGDSGPPVWAPRTAEAMPARSGGTAFDPAH